MIKRPPIRKKRSKIGGRKSLSKRDNFSKDEIVNFLKRNSIKLQSTIFLYRNDYQCPSISQVVYTFGSWENAMNYVWGRSDFVEPEATIEYLTNLVCKFELWNASKYLKERRKNPDLVPPYNHILKKWVSYNKLIAEIRSKNLWVETNIYISLWRNRDKKPTINECKKNNINLEGLVRFYGSKAELDWLASSFLRAEAEKKKVV